MVKSINIWKSIVIGVFLLNIFIIAFPVNTGYLETSEHFFTSWLRTLGLEPQHSDYYKQVPLLTSGSPYSIPRNQSYAKEINLKLSEYFVPGWADTRWQYRKNITIDSTKVNSDLINFPLLIDLYDSDLQQDGQASGNDIMFTDVTGSILEHEIELYERVYNSSHAHLVAWVKINLSCTQDTIISMYYGNNKANSLENAENVWSSDYIAVWHLDEIGNGTSDEYKDSTINQNHGTGGGSAGVNPPAFPPSQVDSQIGYGQEFNESTQEHIEIQTSTSLENPTTSITIGLFINLGALLRTSIFFGFSIKKRLCRSNLLCQ